MWGRLPFAGDDDADVGDGEGGVGLALGRPSVGDVDALRGIAADVGRTTRGGGLDEMAALFQPFLPFIQHPAGPGGDVCQPANPQVNKNYLMGPVRCGSSQLSEAEQVDLTKLNVGFGNR